MHVSFHLTNCWVRVWSEWLRERRAPGTKQGTGEVVERRSRNKSTRGAAEENWSVLKIETDTDTLNLYLPPGHAQIIAKAWPDLEISDTERTA